MGKEYTIDIRIWAVFLALAYYLGRTDVFGMLPNNDQSSSQTTVTTTTTTEPSSQHFQLDLKGVSTELLQSNDELIKALTTATTKSNLQIVSISCGNAFSCLAVSDQAQISIQAWPHNNAVSVDVIQYGSSSSSKVPVSLVSGFQQAFGVDMQDENSESFWAVDYRGQAMDHRYNEAYSEVSNSMIQKVKQLLFQGIVQGKKLEIWNVLDIDISLKHEDAVEHNLYLQPDDPRWTNNELAKPMRFAYEDGHTIVTTDPENQFYQEIMVHPAVMTQENPAKIAILGGPGSIIREILKSSKLDSITWLQPNEQLVRRIQEFIPETFDCSDLEGRSDNCLEDSALSWLRQDPKDYFGGNVNGLFNVIMSHVEQPPKAEEFSSYVASVMKGLSPDGALMLSLGTAPTILHPRGDVGHFSGFEKLFQTLEGLDEVESMMVFEEDFSLSGFTTEIVPQAFLLVCKSVTCRQRFYSKPEWIESQLPERYIGRSINKPTLEYYDGAVHARMQIPPKAYETIYCRREPMPVECAYRNLDFERPMFEFDENVDKSAFEVTDQGVLATVDIPEGSYIMAKDLARSLAISESALGDSPSGRVSLFGGPQSRVLELGISGRIRTTASTEESNVGCWFCPAQRPKYSPVFDRHFASFDSFLVATKAISKGEELVRLLPKLEVSHQDTRVNTMLQRNTNLLLKQSTKRAFTASKNPAKGSNQWSSDADTLQDRPAWSEEWKKLNLGATLYNGSFPSNLFFVQLGFGVDQHGDRTNATKAAIRAVRNSIEFNSIPGVIEHIPGGRKEMLIHVKLGIPEQATVDVMEVAKVFPYGRLLPIETTVGGLEFATGRVVEELGDQDDIGVCVVACVSIGYDKEEDKHNSTHKTYNTKDGY